jgi:hypothetical protein
MPRVGSAEAFALKVFGLPLGNFAIDKEGCDAIVTSLFFGLGQLFSCQVEATLSGFFHPPPSCGFIFGLAVGSRQRE